MPVLTLLWQFDFRLLFFKELPHFFFFEFFEFKLEPLFCDALFISPIFSDEADKSNQPSLSMKAEPKSLCECMLIMKHLA